MKVVNCRCSSRSAATATSCWRPTPPAGRARHRVHARVEGFIRCAKDTGLARWPSHSFAINTAWVTAVALAIDLLCWMRLLLLDGLLAKAEPATLRYRLLHAAARLVNHSRHLILRIPQTWPWAHDFAEALNRVRDCPDLTSTPAGSTPRKEYPRAKGPASPHDTRRHRLPADPKSKSTSGLSSRQARGPTTVNFRGLRRAVKISVGWYVCRPELSPIGFFC